MRYQATYSDLAKSFNRVTDVRGDVRGMRLRGVTDHEDDVLHDVYDMLSECRDMLEGLIDAHPSRKAKATR